MKLLIVLIEHIHMHNQWLQWLGSNIARLLSFCLICLWLILWLGSLNERQRKCSSLILCHIFQRLNAVDLVIFFIRFTMASGY